MTHPDRAPDSVDPFVGWKGLYADREGRLYSQHKEEEWPEGQRFVASCAKGTHEPPGRYCSCGVYALDTFENLRKQNYNFMRPRSRMDDGPVRIFPGMVIPASAFGDGRERVWVLVNVFLWGNVRPGAIGWRASFARVKKVWVPPQMQDLGIQIRRRHGCKIGFIDRFTGERR